MRLSMRLIALMSAAFISATAAAGPGPHHHNNTVSTQPVCHSQSECPYRHLTQPAANLNVHHQPRPAHRHAIVTPGYAVKVPATITMVNAPHHRASGVSLDKGVRVFRPAENANLAYAASVSLAEQRARTDQAAQDRAARRQARQLAQQNEALQASLDAIQANQSAILARTARRGAFGPSRRRTFYGNPPFFGSNGFIGNSNFSGASVQIERSARRKNAKTVRAAH